MNQDESSYPCSFVIFGATGHLAATKLLPALYHLEAHRFLPEVTSFIATARRPWNDAAWRAHMEEALRAALGGEFDAQLFDKFARRFSYVAGDLTDAQTYQRLLAQLSKPKPAPARTSSSTWRSSPPSSLRSPTTSRPSA